jgi:hypothetical protein
LPRDALLLSPFRKTKTVPFENPQLCRRISNGMPFSLMGWVLGNGLKAVEDSGFCRHHSLKELSTVMLRERSFELSLPLWATEVGGWETWVYHETSVRWRFHHEKGLTSISAQYNRDCQP